VKVKLAKTAGFCMGVRRALEIVLSEVNKGQVPLYTFGPLIHNEQVMKLLESKGVMPLEEIDAIDRGTLIIRAHGIPPDQRRRLKASGLGLIDATCPRVARVQAIIRYHTNKGYLAIIVGERDHPEVIGLLGYGGDRARVINTVEELADLKESDKVILVAQTTQEKRGYEEIVKGIKDRFPDALVFDTICDATRDRQEEIRTMAPEVDAFVVVGGRHSGNTRRLAQVATATGIPTFHVETEEELDKEKLSSFETIGVTAGASTPNWMIRRVIQRLEAIRGRRETAAGRFTKKAFKFLFQTNFVSALGAFSLTHAATLLSGRGTDLIHSSLAFFYIYAMHVLNRFLDKGASAYNDPERAMFYRRHRPYLTISALVSLAAALALSYSLGTSLFLAMVGLSVLGTIYSIPIVPSSRREMWRYTKLKDIPGSKTLSQALAWGAVIALLPLLEPMKGTWASAIVSFLFVFTIVYVRSALFDIFQVQGDLVVGVETLPITLGEKRTLSLLKAVILAGALILVGASLLGLVGPFSYLLLLSLLSLCLCLFAYEKRWLYPGLRLEAMVEGTLLVPGLLGLLWLALT